MKHFVKVGEVDVMPLLGAINAHPELWNRHDFRKTAPNTPHRQMSDIWIRYNDASRYKESFAGFNDPHEPIWYPAYYELPELRGIIFDLMRKVEGERLGGILITRIPPDGRIKPHVDTGWHVEYYNTKLYVVLQSNEQCYNRTEHEVAVMRQGEVWHFDNTKEHEVWNEGQTDRMTLIVCIRSSRTPSNFTQ